MTTVSAKTPLSGALFLQAYLGVKPEGKALSAVPSSRDLYSAIVGKYGNDADVLGERCDMAPSRFGQIQIAHALKPWIDPSADPTGVFPPLSDTFPEDRFFSAVDGLVQAAMGSSGEDVVALAQAMLKTPKLPLQPWGGRSENISITDFLSGQADNFILTETAFGITLFKGHSRTSGSVNAMLASLESNTSIPEQLKPHVAAKCQELRGRIS